MMVELGTVVWLKYDRFHLNRITFLFPVFCDSISTLYVHDVLHDGANERQDLLKARPNSIALVVSTENLTQNLYLGNERSMLLQVRYGVLNESYSVALRKSLGFMILGGRKRWGVGVGVGQLCASV